MIHTTRLVDLFCELVAIDNPSLGERQICNRIKEKLEALNISYCEDNAGDKIGGSCGNLYAYIDGEMNLPPLLLSAHMDTVTPVNGKTAICHPDGRITSGGTTVLGADDLSGIAVILEVLTVLKEKGLPHRPLELLFDVAEETYCTGIQVFDFSSIKAKEAYIFDLSGAIGTAAYQAPSIIAFQAAIYGRAAHAAFSPESGIHAIKIAANAISAIECGTVKNTTVNIGTISGGEADNIVPERCVITGEVRSFSDADAKAQLAIIETQFRQAVKNDGATMDFQTEILCQAYCLDQNSTVVRRFQKACAKIDLVSSLSPTYGGSDNNHFMQHGIEGIVIASGMNNCHSCQEYTSIAELERAAQLALAIILEE